MTSTSGEKKCRNFNCFFQFREQVVIRRGDPENRVGDQDTENPGRPVSFGLQVPSEPGHCRARTRHPW
jgi:hypothetical protein